VWSGLAAGLGFAAVLLGCGFPPQERSSVPDPQKKNGL